MDLGIQGKVAVVTGGSHGIGRAIAEELGRNGCKVVVVARGKADLDSTVDAIRAEGGEATAVTADLTVLEDYPRIADEAKAVFGIPEIAIYAPVGPIPGLVGEFTDEDFDRFFSYVVKGFNHFTRALVPGMKERGWGRIVTVGSGHGRLPARRATLGFDYAMANVVRPAALGLSRSLADELAPFGITVNTVPPGFVDTGKNYDAFFKVCAERVGLSFEDFMQGLISRIPVQRFGRPEEVASLCVFLCSAKASYITGQYMMVDGGHMAVYF